MSQIHLTTKFRLLLLLSLLSGVLVFLSFEKFNLPVLAFLFPTIFNWLSMRPLKLKRAFFLGFLTSFTVMLGGFYWVTYVIHEFGYLPWSLSSLIFLVFAGFGALNFPIFLSIMSFLNQKLDSSNRGKWFWVLWFTLFTPAVFAVVEFFFPKIFPWYLGHCLYRWTFVTQIVEITGSLFLSFLIYSLGSALGLIFFCPVPLKKSPWEALIIPCFLLSLALGFSQYRLSHPPETNKTLKVAVIQANIGSLEKIHSENDIQDIVDQVITKYIELTETALKSNPDLIVWPETAMPYSLGHTPSRDQFLMSKIKHWQRPLITGGYTKSDRNYFKDYNGAFLIEPLKNGEIRVQSYMKNILLAFGEYFPMGDFFPVLYKYFPQVADFERGDSQKPVTLEDGTTLGITICYEAIVPSFYRKVANHSIQGVINLTNDSWFGPTSEPYLHGSLTVFRSLETKLPMVRATNTGLSFSVDSLGRQSSTTQVYSPQIFLTELKIPISPPQTIYLQYGDWFVLLLILIQTLFAIYFKRFKVN